MKNPFKKLNKKIKKFFKKLGKKKEEKLPKKEKKSKSSVLPPVEKKVLLTDENGVYDANALPELNYQRLSQLAGTDKK